VSAMDMVRQWQKTVKLNFLPELHGHQVKALASFSWAMAQVGSCASGALAAAVPGRASPASVRRRLERTLANGPRLDVTAAMLQMTRALTSAWGGCGRQVLLILDETPKANHLRCMRLSVAYHKRTVPLSSICYRPNDPPLPMPKLVRQMLRQVAACLPADLNVTLLADRGLCWPTLIRQCRRLRWHYLLRLQGGTQVRLSDGSVQSVQELAARPGTRWFGQEVQVFKKARWLRANVTAVWEEDAKEPWLLVSDQPASYRGCCQRYCKRTWCEESHRDDRAAGSTGNAAR